MENELNQENLSQENGESQENQQISEQEVMEAKEAQSKELEATQKPAFDYRKEREERAKKRAEKAFLGELGVNSLDEIKSKINSLEEYRKEVEELKNEVNKSKVNGYKVEVLKNGFDEKFVDYIVYELKDKISENDDFSSLLGKFKKENSQFLKNSNPIKFSTAPNFEQGSKLSDMHARMNDFFSGRSTTI